MEGLPASILPFMRATHIDDRPAFIEKVPAFFGVEQKLSIEESSKVACGERVLPVRQDTEEALQEAWIARRIVSRWQERAANYGKVLHVSGRLCEWREQV